MGKPLSHEDYRIPGTNMFSFSQWSRENIPKPPPKFKVGDVVVLTTKREITHVGEDCDGTILYTLDGLGPGWSEESLELATSDDDFW